MELPAPWGRPDIAKQEETGQSLLIRQAVGMKKGRRCKKYRPGRETKRSC